MQLFRSARTSWNTFVRPSVRPSVRQKYKSHLKPFKSSKDHARPLIWNIAVKGTMSSIIPWWQLQRQRQIQRQRQTEYPDVFRWKPKQNDYGLMEAVYMPDLCRLPLCTSIGNDWQDWQTNWEGVVPGRRGGDTVCLTLSLFQADETFENTLWGKAK